MQHLYPQAPVLDKQPVYFNSIQMAPQAVPQQQLTKTEVLRTSPSKTCSNCSSLSSRKSLTSRNEHLSTLIR